MSLQDFLSPVSIEHEDYLKDQIGYSILRYDTRFPELEEVDLVLLGVEESRQNPDNHESNKAPDAIRKQLYKLYTAAEAFRIADIGTIKAGNTVFDTHVALSTVVHELIEQHKTVIVIGGTHDLTFGQYAAYQKREQMVEMAIIDAIIDVDLNEGGAPTADTFLQDLLLSEPGIVQNLSHIGHQTYLNSQHKIHALSKLRFEGFRLGEVRSNVAEMEPVLRAANLLSIDLKAVKAADAPGNRLARPNGLSAEEICQLARYAGMNDSLSSIGIYELNPSLDRQNLTAMLVAEMIWCFMDGYTARRNDHPRKNKTDFTRFVADLTGDQQELIFFKSKKSGKWWMEVPSPIPTSNERTYLIPCSYADYEQAMKGELPYRWVRMQEKLL